MCLKIIFFADEQFLISFEVRNIMISYQNIYLGFCKFDWICICKRVDVQCPWGTLCHYSIRSLLARYVHRKYFYAIFYLIFFNLKISFFSSYKHMGQAITILQSKRHMCSCFYFVFHVFIWIIQFKIKKEFYCSLNGFDLLIHMPNIN